MTDKNEEDKKPFEVEEEIYEFLLDGKKNGMSTDFCLGYYTAFYGALQYAEGQKVKGVNYDKIDVNSTDFHKLFAFLNKLRDDNLTGAPAYTANINPSDIAKSQYEEVKETLENFSKAQEELGSRMEAEAEKMKKEKFEDDYPWGIGEYDVNTE